MEFLCGIRDYFVALWSKSEVVTAKRRLTWYHPNTQVDSVKFLVFDHKHLQEHINIVKAVFTKSSDRRLVVCQIKQSLFTSGSCLSVDV